MLGHVLAQIQRGAGKRTIRREEGTFRPKGQFGLSEEKKEGAGISSAH
jgi:hypothetical protein